MSFAQQLDEATGTITLKRLGATQTQALEMYIFDPAHNITPFPGKLKGKTLTVTDASEALDLLNNAAESARDDKDRQFAVALDKVWARVAKARG